MRFGPVALAAAMLAGCDFLAEYGGAPAAGAIDDARMLAADSDPDNWLGYCRTYAEQRFSPIARLLALCGKSTLSTQGGSGAGAQRKANSPALPPNSATA